MTISSETTKNVYTLNESTTTFPYTFKIWADSDLEVILLNTTSGAETVLTLMTDYTVTGAGDADGGNVEYSGAVDYGSAYKLVIRSNTPNLQLTDYEENDDFAAETHESALDKLCRQIQQVAEQIDRGVQQNSAQTSAIVFPALVSGKYLYTDGTTVSWVDATDFTDINSYQGTISRGLEANKPAAPTVGDMYLATDTNILYKCLSNGVWSYSYVVDDLTVAGDAGVTGDITCDGDITVSGAAAIAGNVTISGTTDLGSGGLQINGSGFMTAIKDEDDMASDSATALATQQSIKAYADTQVATALFSDIEDYVASYSSSTSKNQSDLKICYGKVTISNNSSQAITNLPFTSATSFVVAAINDGSSGSNDLVTECTRNSGSQITFTNPNSGDEVLLWIAIGT